MSTLKYLENEYHWLVALKNATDDPQDKVDLEKNIKVIRDEIYKVKPTWSVSHE